MMKWLFHENHFHQIEVQVIYPSLTPGYRYAGKLYFTIDAFKAIMQQCQETIQFVEQPVNPV